MSKLDAQRAMREANYARNRASGSSRGDAAPVGRTVPPPVAGPGRTVPPPVARPARPAAPEPAPAPAAGEAGRCGHKSMNGRACTREAAHPEKNHRYS